MAYAGRPYDMVRISRDVAWTYWGRAAPPNNIGEMNVL